MEGDAGALVGARLMEPLGDVAQQVLRILDALVLLRVHMEHAMEQLPGCDGVQFGPELVMAEYILT